jgi:hypothetical protein
MKLLFFARHYSYLRLFESAISDLASRGHQIHLSADREESMGGRRLAERLAETCPGVTLGATPGRAADAWSEFSRRLRLGIDYLVPIFSDAIGEDDMEHTRRTLFAAGNLSRPYHSINTDINKRIRYLG